MFESCSGAKRQDARGIDLVENGHFAVETCVARERILFEIADLRLDTVGGAANRADGRHGIMFAPSASSTDAYCDCTRPSSIGSIPESSYELYGASWLVDWR